MYLYAGPDKPLALEELVVASHQQVEGGAGLQGGGRGRGGRERRGEGEMREAERTMEQHACTYM